VRRIRRCQPRNHHGFAAGRTLDAQVAIIAITSDVLAAMRTGIAVFALPLSVLSALIATSKYYNIWHVLHFLLPLLVINVGLIVLGCYLVIHSISRIRHYDRLIKTLKKEHSAIAEFLD